MKKLLRVFSFVLGIMIIFLMTADACAETFDEKMKKGMSSLYSPALSYAKKRMGSSFSSFDGYCGLCVGCYLQAAGLYKSYPGTDGYKSYDKYKSNPPSGYSVRSYPAARKGGSYTIESICNAINNRNTEGLNTYVVFGFNKGSTSSGGQKYGHVCLVHCIYNGKVYWTESYTSTPQINTISAFVNRYKQRKESGKDVYVLDGAVEFYKPEDEIKSVDRSFYKTNKSTKLYSSTDTSSNSLGINKDIGVIVTGKKTVSGQVWYKTSDNYYIKAEDITFVEKAPEIGGYSIVDASVKFTAEIKYDGLYLEDEPYADAKNMCYITHSEKLNIKGLYKNKYQNYWVGVEKDGRLFYTCANNIRFISEDTSNDVTISGKNYAPDGVVTDGSLFPIGTKKKGASFDIRGKVSSPYTIKSAQGFVYSGSPINIKVDTKTSLVTINKTSFDLYSSNINIAKNGGIAFGKLSEGNKAFRLLVNYEKPVWHDITNEKENPVSKKECSKNFYSVFSIESNNDNNPFADISDEVRVISIALDTSSITMNAGESYTISATINPSNATNKTVIWSSNNQSVATVNGNGTVTAVAPGTATITVTTADGGKIASCTVDVTTTYTVTMNPNGGSVSTTTKVVTYGTTYGTMPTPTRTGYTFAGWWTAKSTSGKQVTESTVCKASGNYTLYARWTPKTYTVTLNPNGGSVSSTTKGITYDAAYGTMPTPTRTGYTFAGWWTAKNTGGKQVTGSTVCKASGNFTLYARWTPKTYTVTLNPNGGSVSSTTKSITYDAAYGTLPTPTRTGYTFAGWWTAKSTGGKQVTESTVCKASGNYTLYARWTPKTYTVTLNPNGGLVSSAIKSITYDAAYGTMPTPTRTGYTFAGWWTAKSTGGKQVTESTVCKASGNFTLYAHWTEEDKIAAFVTRCYSIILGREPDASGMQTWYEQLSSGNKAAAEIIDQFVNSPEFSNKHYSHSESVEILYKAMLGRDSDAAGKANWVSKLDAGQPFAVVINGFCNSKEFTGICASYGIKPGSVNVQLSGKADEEALSMLALKAKAPITRRSETKPNRVEIINPSDTIDMNIGTAVQAVYINEEKAKEFIGRCYKEILGRDASQAELENWVGQMVNGTKTPDQIARGFLFSNEFKSKNIGNEDLVKILYRVYMNRDTDPEGMKTWMEKLDGGMELKDVLDSLAKTSEYKKVISEMSK